VAGIYVGHLKVSLDSPGNTLSEVVDVATIQAGHGYPTISGHVDMGLLGESLGLGGSQASKTEHSNLALDVTPLSRSVVGGGQEVVKPTPHADDPVGHELDLGLPNLVKVLVGEDGVGDTGTVEGRVGVHWSDDDLQLTFDTSLLLGIGGDEGESTNTFTVETHVLREGLGQSDLVTLLNEMTDGERVVGGVSRGETLVRHVEEREKLLLLDDVRDFPPLGRGGVDASGIVGAGMQENDSTLWGFLYIQVDQSVNSR
jgi:hypothetical protein